MIHGIVICWTRRTTKKRIACGVLPRIHNDYERSTQWSTWSILVFHSVLIFFCQQSLFGRVLDLVKELTLFISEDIRWTVETAQTYSGCSTSDCCLECPSSDSSDRLWMHEVESSISFVSSWISRVIYSKHVYICSLCFTVEVIQERISRNASLVP